MKRILTAIFVLCMSIVSISAQTEQFGIPALPGWNRLKGDEFNGTDVDRFAWGMYGDAREDYKFDTYGSNGKTGSVHIYRDQMISVKNGILTLRATRDAILTGLYRPEKPDNDVDYSVLWRKPIKREYAPKYTGWWSGALSSKDAKNHGRYYPLYSRIEVKAKIPYAIGVWMALWLRHRYGGAGNFEIDLQEFFVNDDDRDIPDKWTNHTYYFKGKRTLHQSVHGMDHAKSYRDSVTNELKYNTTYNHNDFADRIRVIDFNPEEDFHVYGAQIDPLPGDSSVHLAVSFLLDGRVRSVFTTKTDMVEGTSEYRYNELLKDKYIKGDIDHIWDVAVTGAMGGKIDTLNGLNRGILYPELDPQYHGKISKVPHNYEMNIDWLRVYKRTNRALWLGSLPKGSDWKTLAIDLNMPAKQFKGLQVGDQLVMDLDTLSNSEFRTVGKLALDVCDKRGKSIITLQPELAQHDAQMTFIVDTDDLCRKLKTEGCTIKGKNIRLFSVLHSSKDSAKWVGFKQIQWGEVLIPAASFKKVSAGQQLEITVRDADVKAQIFLRQFKQPAQGEHDRPSLSSDKTYGHILNLTAGADEKVYTFTLNAQAVEELKQHGLAITGKGYYLRSVRVTGRGDTDTAIKDVKMHVKTDPAVYTLYGIKVANQWQAGTLPRGIYIVGGRKIVVQ